MLDPQLLVCFFNVVSSRVFDIIRKQEVARLEYHRATNIVKRLKGHVIDIIQINQIPIHREDELQDLIIVLSKNSLLASTLLERATVALLNDLCSLEFRWVRMEISFPDVQLMLRNGRQTPYDLELKVLYVLSEEPSARFWTSSSVLQPDCVSLVIARWGFTEDLFGKPCVDDVGIFDAYQVALARDRKIYDPPNTIIVEPFDSKSDPKNKQQHTITVGTLQNQKKTLERATQIVNKWRKKNNGYSGDHRDERKLVTRLLTEFSYKPNTNPGKINRLKI